jgi:hypothetical protein
MTIIKIGAQHNHWDDSTGVRLIQNDNTNEMELVISPYAIMGDTGDTYCIDFKYLEDELDARFEVFGEKLVSLFNKNIFFSGFYKDEDCLCMRLDPNLPIKLLAECIHYVLEQDEKENEDNTLLQLVCQNVWEIPEEEEIINIDNITIVAFSDESVAVRLYHKEFATEDMQDQLNAYVHSELGVILALMVGPAKNRYFEESRDSDDEWCMQMDFPDNTDLDRLVRVFHTEPVMSDIDNLWYSYQKQLALN